jgi:hypothetical protein
MKLDPPALRQVVARTLEHYHSRAEAFWEGTRNHDVAQNIEALLRHIQAAAPYTILDFGCGPGRDLRNFRAAAGTASSVWKGRRHWREMARAHGGCEVWLAGFSCGLELARRLFRRGVRQCFPVPRTDAGVAARLATSARDAETGRCAVQLESSRRQPGERQRRALRRLPRSRGVAALPRCGRICRTRALLPSSGFAHRTAALARQRLAQGGTEPDCVGCGLKRAPNKAPQGYRPSLREIKKAGCSPPF